MSKTLIPESSADDSPASKMAKIHQGPASRPKFKILNRLTSMSFIDQSAEEGSLFPGSPMVEGEPQSSYNFQMRSIQPKLLNSSCFKQKSNQKIHQSLRNADLKKLNKIHKTSKKKNFSDLSQTFNSRKEESVLAESGERSGRRDSFLASIHEDVCVYAKVPPSFKSSFGFSMKTKKLMTKNAILDDGGFNTEETAE